MVTNVAALERFALLLAGVLTLLAISATPSKAWPSVEEPTITGAAAYADVTLDIFSGRPNPQWTLAAEEIAPLLPGPGAQPIAGADEPPGLGYRGFLITYVSAETGVPVQYRAYAGAVTIGSKGEQRILADDKGLELWLLEDARQRGYGDLLESV